MVLAWQQFNPHSKVNTGSAFWVLPDTVGWCSGGEQAAVRGRGGTEVHLAFQFLCAVKNLSPRNALPGKKNILMHFSIISK